ncbi:hypothetical protein [Rummeliibacillus stabekisii]|uniref:Uncharacterized protein n=1 Tax=Rummeliibacillus stabekisii TaxID=241244 RepID=A0A143HCP5_9BACL|nr:hypothetical protein [Rummeliibacillus stabekisii]AMW99199.1 hypothetical protein ATY39_06815 [Rummeliibacillus stabekisii]
MNNEQIYQRMIRDLGKRIATSEIEKVEAYALLEQAQHHVDELLKQVDELKKGGEKKDESGVTE